jgi:adenylate kinase family enzyme
VNARVQRADDTEEKAQTRIGVYKDNVEAVNAYYKDQIVEIDGNTPMETVFEQVEAALDKLLVVS